MIKKALIGILFVIALFLVGCAGYSGNYRYNPYYEYYRYPYGFHGYPYEYHGYGHHSRWHHW